MTNVFLKVNKDLFLLGLNPVELLILSQVMEFNANTGDCFISDKTLAAQFGVSESTIKRAIKVLEEKKFITRSTKNVKGGKERHMIANIGKIDAAITSVKMSFDKEVKASQSSNCSLTSVKMSFDKEQIDTIKDNLQDKEKDNISELEQPTAVLTLQELPQGAVLQKPVSELTEREKMERFKKEFGF